MMTLNNDIVSNMTVNNIRNGIDVTKDIVPLHLHMQCSLCICMCIFKSIHILYSTLITGLDVI